MKSRVNFSITQLEYIWAVYKHGHFAKAAEACNVTQPTLSMQVQKLEEDLGITIFDRSKKPILLTDVGKKIIDQVQAVLFEAKKIESIVVQSESTGVQGELIVGVIPTIAPYLLPLMLPVLEKNFPELKLKILELQTSRIVDQLNSDEIDVGILATPLNLSKVIEIPLFYEPFLVLSKKDHALSKLKKVKYAHLTNEDVWLLEEGHCLRNQVVDICSLKSSKKSKRNFQFESGSIETLKRLVNSYGGYTLIPQLAAEDIGDHSTVIPFERPIPSREIGLVYQRAHYKENLIETLAEAILKSIPDEVRRIRQKDLDVLGIV
ncbi:MAG: LysR family transcriptional regulator [Bdellovibrionaceae bacterium]|nr:LysR family transcriptional regulator [Pseudobdellovibrionaceae bacterium]